MESQDDVLEIVSDHSIIGKDGDGILPLDAGNLYLLNARLVIVELDFFHDIGR